MSKYKVVRELGRNREGGRITYLATDTSLNPPQQVVIKEFRLEGAYLNKTNLEGARLGAASVVGSTSTSVGSTLLSN
jgi:hypothetical protein